MASSPLFLQFLVLLLLPPLLVSPSYAQSHRNISLGSSLCPHGRNTSWLSPSGEFAFGFRPVETDCNLFLLAIWFEKIEEKTVVWYANEGKLMQNGSMVELTTDGQLMLKDHSGQVWSAGINKASYAAMFDTGNFVLFSTDDSVMWQSFNTPTDTILPSQVLHPGTELQARLTATDYSSGRFRLGIQDGNLVLYTVAVPSGNQYDPYWTSDTVGNGSKLVFNESGRIYLAQKNGSIFNFTSATVRMDVIKDFYQRATLDFDGVFRQYVYPRNGMRKGSWDESWDSVDFQPPDICKAITAKTGSGACGYNSYCKIDERQHVDCECPPGYSFFDPSRKYKGCKPDFAAQSCDTDEKEMEALYELEEMLYLDWPLSDYEQLYPMGEDKCRKECLSDCFCVAVTYNDRNCSKMKAPLSNGRMGNYVETKSLIKVPGSNNNHSQPPIPTGEGKEKKSWTRIRSLLLWGSVLINILLIAGVLVLVFYSYTRIHSLHPNSSETGTGLRSLTYKEIEEATNNFSEQLDYGGLGEAYKGYLRGEASTCVAVKRIGNLLPDTEVEFINVVKAIGQASHKNLVRLLGFCNEGTQRCLIYEFLSTGPLKGFLFGSIRLKWDQRIQVALGIARGLLYLHEECGTQIIHCDIHSRNILMDDNFVAKISNFELGKLLRADQTRANIAVRGTVGYIAPEWFKNMGITAKVDVYSFGVTLLEIICCRRFLEPVLENGKATKMTNWVNSCYRNGRLDMVVGGDEEALFDMRKVERFVAVALWCVQEEPSLRPTMWKVTQMLDGAVTVPEPPDPSSYISSIQ